MEAATEGEAQCVGARSEYQRLARLPCLPRRTIYITDTLHVTHCDARRAAGCAPRRERARRALAYRCWACATQGSRDLEIDASRLSGPGAVCCGSRVCDCVCGLLRARCAGPLDDDTPVVGSRRHGPRSVPRAAGVGTGYSCSGRTAVWVWDVRYVESRWCVMLKSVSLRACVSHSQSVFFRFCIYNCKCNLTS